MKTGTKDNLFLVLKNSMASMAIICYYCHLLPRMLERMVESLIGGRVFNTSHLLTEAAAGEVSAAFVASFLVVTTAEYFVLFCGLVVLDEAFVVSTVAGVCTTFSHCCLSEQRNRIHTVSTYNFPSLKLHLSVLCKVLFCNVFKNAYVEFDVEILRFMWPLNLDVTAVKYPWKHLQVRCSWLGITSYQSITYLGS